MRNLPFASSKNARVTQLLCRIAACLTFCVAGCGDSVADFDGDVGDLTMTLGATSSSGVEYQLRDAVFLIRGPQDEDVFIEDYPPEQTVIDVSLASGSYQVTLQDGWRMEYSANGQAFADIPATLVSPNPGDVEVFADQVAPLTLNFEVDERLINFGPGTLAIDLRVAEVDLLGAPDDDVDPVTPLTMVFDRGPVTSTNRVSFPSGDTEDNVPYRVEATGFLGFSGNLIIRADCTGVGAEHVQFFWGGLPEAHACGTIVVDTIVTDVSNNIGSVTVRAVGGDATLVEWTLTGEAAPELVAR